MTNESFGDYVRVLREMKGIGQRELARNLEISASYLNDIEKNKRGAPRAELVRSIGALLEADESRLFDLAGNSRNDIAVDVAEMVRESPETVELLRTLLKFRPTEEVIRNIREGIIASSTSAIVVAAGLDSRAELHTDDKPKCLLKFGKKTLLQRQLEIYRRCGITDLAVVRGYMKEKINYAGVRYFENPEFSKNNVLNSLFYGEEALKGHVICAYSDILFESHVVERLLQSTADISIVVDIDWRGYYADRESHPIKETENVVLDAENKVIDIGKIPTNKTDVHGEFIGMMKFSPNRAEIFKRHFHRAKRLYWDKPFQRAPLFQKAYLTDMIQEIVDLGVPVHCVIIERGWKEIDTLEDYEEALKEFAA